VLDFARVYGPGITYNPRTAWSGYHMLRRGDESVRDAYASWHVTLTGGTPTIIFQGSCSERARAFVTGAGLPWPEQALPYADQAEYTTILRERAARPRSVVFQNAHPPDPFLDPAYWIPRALLVGLNDKGELDTLVPPEATPPRRIVSLEQAARLPFEPGTTVVLKGSTEMSTGSGGAVVIARSEAQVRSVAERLAGSDRVVVEEFQPFTRTMCVTWAADYKGQVEYIGSADQIVGDDGSYLASWIGPDLQPSADVIAMTRGIIRQAADRGYIGYAGFDVGLLPDGRALCFDLNFRICGSTPALLWYEEAKRRFGPETYVRVISISGRMAFDRLCAIGERLVADNAFLPLGGFAPAGTIWGDRNPVIRGILTGRDRAEAEARCETLLAQGLTFR
jgi:hypothetical protein